MKNQLLIAMMVVASLLFIATGANAQGCSGSYQWNPYLRPAGSDQQACIPGLAPAGSATQGDKGEMVPAGAATVGAAKMTGLMGAHEWAGQFNIGRDYCNYCSIFTGLP